MSRKADMSELVGAVEPIGASGDTLFIMCTSYEERGAASVRKLSPQYSAQLSVICRAAEYLDKGKSPEFYEEAFHILSGHTKNDPIELVFRMEDPIALAQQLENRLRSKGMPEQFPNVTLDISTFPRQQLLLLLKFLDNSPYRSRIRLLYSEPARYATEAQNEEDRWLTRGVTSVHSVPGFSGVQYPRLGKLLVVIQGHEGERTHITLRRHQPDKVIFVGQSDIQYHAGLREIAEAENQDMLAIYGSQCLWGTRLPARGITETAHEIEQIYSEFRHQYNLFVAPFGTKLQLLGTYLAARELPDIQIIYASAAVHNWDLYSKGMGRLWEMELGVLESNLEREEQMAV